MPGNKALNVKVNMQVDSSQARQEVQTLAKEIKQVTSLANSGSFNGGLGIAKDINEAIKAAGNLKSALAEAVNPLTGNLNLTKFNDQLKASGMTLTDYRNQLQALGPMGTQTFNQLSRAITSAETPLLRTGKAAQTLWTTIGNTVRWQATSSLLHGVMSTASQAMNYVKNLDSSLNSIRIVTGQSQAQMEKFARTANQAAKDLNTTTNAYAQASLIYYQQGLSNKEVEDRTRTTIKLANVSGQAASKVSDQLTAIWNNFYDGSKSLEYYADVMTALGASTASSTDEIAKGLEKFSAIAKTTGLSYEYATSALSTVVAATRQSADSVGTSFKTLFSRLQGLSLGETLDDGTTLNKYSKALNTIGVNIKNANGSLKDMDTILDEIGSKWTTLSKAEQVALAQTVGGARNYTGLVSLMDNWDDFQTNLKTAQQAQGTLQNQADIYAQSWEAASKHVRAASETIYKNLLDDKVFKGLTNGFGGVLDIIGSITNSLGGFGGTMTALVAMSSRLWAPQLSKSFTNIGLNARGLIGGQDEVLRLKQDARDQLKNFTPVTRSTEAGILAQRYQENFAKRTDLYQKGVDNGRINQFMQPGYQLMLNALNASEERAISTAEQAYNSKQNLGQIEQEIRQAYNYNMSQREKDIAPLEKQRDDLLKKLDEKNSKGTNVYTGKRRDAIQTQINNLNKQIGNVSANNVPQDRENFNQLLQQYRAAQSQSTSINNLFNNFPLNGTMTGSQASALVAQVRAMVTGLPEGATLESVYGKELGDLLEKTYKQTNAIINSSKFTPEERGKFLASYFNTASGQDMFGQLETLRSGNGDEIEELSAKITSQLTKSGMSQSRIDSLMAGLKQGNIQSASDAYRAIIAKGGSHEEGMNALKALGIEADKAPIVSGGQAATMMTQGFASLGTSLLSAANAYKVFNDQNATAGQKATALVTTMGTLPMTISSISSIWGKWDNAIANTSLTVGKLAGGLGIAAAAIGVTVTAIKQIEKSSDASALKALTEQSAVATQTVSDAQTKYDNLLSSKESHNNLFNKLSNLQKGTQDFTLALINANEAARNLIDEYSLIYGQDYTYGKNNEIIINQASLNQAEENAIKDIEFTSRGKAINTYASNLLNIKEQQNEAEKANINNFLDSVISKDNIDVKTSLGALINNKQFLNYIMNGENVQGLFEVAGKEKNIKDIDTWKKNLTTSLGLSSDAEIASFLRNYYGAIISDNIEGSNQHISRDQLLTSQLEKVQGEFQLEERQANALGMLETIAQSSENKNDLTSFATQYMSNNPQFLQYQEAIAKALYTGTEDTLREMASHFLGTGQFSSLEDTYRALFNTAIIPQELLENQDELKFRISTKLAEELEFNGLTAETRKMVGSEVANLLEGFNGINSVLSQLSSDENLKELANYSSSNISDITSQILNLNEQIRKNPNLDRETQQIYANIIETLNSNISSVESGLLQTLSTYASDTTPGNIETIFQSLIGQYDLSQLQTITNYMTQAGSVFGTKTFQNLTSTFMKGTNQKTLDNLSKVNWDDTFSALGDIDRLAKSIGGERNIYSEILNGAIDDLGAEGGIFQKLYNSSGFQDVIVKLGEQFKTMGSITTEYVGKLAAKNEDLNSVLNLGRSGYSGLNINAAGLASLLTAITADKINASQVSSALVSSLSTAGALEASKQNAFNIVDNQDFGRSGTDLLDYFINGQKTYLNAQTQDLTFDTPLRNFFEHMMPTSVRDAYYAANENGNGKTFSQIIEESDIPQPVKDFLNNTNKKGTKSINTWSDIIDLYGGFIKESNISDALKTDMLTGTSEEIQAMLGENATLADYMREVYGLGFENGNITLYQREGEEGYAFTTQQTEENLTKIFSQFMSPADASAQAAIWTAHIGESSSGTALLRNDAKAAEEELKGKAANTPGGRALYSPEELQTAFSTYGYWAGYGSDQYEAFKNNILSGGGRIAPELEKNFWQNQKANTALIAVGQAYANANENLNVKGGQAGFEALLKDFGAYDNEGNIDFNKFGSLIEFLGGSPDQINSLLDANSQIFENINTHFMDRFGNTHDIKWNGEESAEEYQQRVTREQNEANSEWFQYQDKNGITQTVHDPLGYMREHYHTAGEINAETGEAYTETGWEEGYNPELTPQSISVSGDKVYGLSQTGEVIEQGSDGKWYKKGEVPTEPTAKPTAKPTTTHTTEPTTTGTAGELKPQDILDMAAEMDQADEDQRYEKKAQEGPRAPNVGQNAENDAIIAAANEEQPLTNAEMRTFLQANGFSGQDIKQAQLEGISLEDLYQQVSDNLEESTDALTTATETTAMEVAETQDALAASIDENLTAMGEALPGSAEYEAAYASASQVSTPDEKLDQLVQLGTESLRQEKFINDNTGATADNVGDLSDTMSEQIDIANEEARMGGTFEEPEYDENGNQINLPSKQKSIQVGSAGSISSNAGASNSGSASLQDLNNAMNYVKNGGSLTSVFNTMPIDSFTDQQRLDLANAAMEAEKQAGTFNARDWYEASGQNNARLLGYAKGKEGYIAVTGELGPELRVKSDGSMDLLGKTGREYTWVEPSDRIYTAAQTASIIGSNNSVPQLEALAKGINNFIPGYATAVASTDHTKTGPGSGSGSSSRSSSSSSSSSSDKDPRYDPYTLKLRDVLERYYVILEKIDDITRAVEKFSAVADRAWGKDRIKAIEQQTEAYKEQYNAQKAYINEINEYLKSDTDTLETMINDFVEEYNEGKDDNDKISLEGAKYDSNGVLTNYDEIVTKLVEQYNENAEANASDDEAQTRYSERIKDIEKYRETLNLWESETDKLQDLANQILDNSLKVITYRVEYELELNADQERLLNFQADQVKDNVYRAAEYLDLLNEKTKVTEEKLTSLRQGIYDYLGTLAGDNLKTGKTYSEVDLGIKILNDNGTEEAINYEDLNFQQITNNLDNWLSELRSKNIESAKEVEKIIQRNSSGIITNYKDVLLKINEMNSKLSLTSIQMLRENVNQFFEELSNTTNNPKWVGLSTEQKEWLTNSLDQIISYLDNISENYAATLEQLGDSIKEFNKKMNTELDEFSYYDDLYNNFKNIVDLTNTGLSNITSSFFSNLNNKALDNNINKIIATRKNYELFSKTLIEVQNQYNEMIERMNNATSDAERQYYQDMVDTLKSQLDIANAQMEEAHKDFLASWEDALSKIGENYKDALEQASKDFEKSFSPMFNTLALLQAQFDREKALGDLYVDNYQKLHDLNKLNRDIDKSITDTDNLKSKARLRDLQKEITQLQEDGTDLSEYDLDILDKKYKLELARQALEDARDAKSIVRLSRDNNGNWGYVYTADEDEIADAEQNYEDAIRDMEQANEDYIKNLQDQILQVQQEAQQAILSLSPDDFDTYEQYLAAIQDIQKQTFTLLDYINSQGKNSFGNQQYLELNIPGIINKDQLTSGFENTPIAKLFGINNLDQLLNNAKNNLVENLIKPALEAYTEYSEKQAEVYQAAGKDIATAGEDFSNAMDIIAEKSNKQTEVVENLAKRIDKSFEETANNVRKVTDEWVDSIRELTDEYTILLEAITKLKRADGEYVEPAKLINADNAIDSWKELSDFKTALGNNGTLVLVTTDNQGNEHATTFKAGAQEINDFIQGAKNNTDTGGYTGRWQSADTGMYTGEWPMGSVRANGRLAWLHQKELVLNAHDTENFLNAMDIVRQLDFLAKMKANGLGDLITPNVNAEQGELEQNVHIDASFPNVQNHNEIEEAFTNLVNMASQYAYRKA